MPAKDNMGIPSRGLEAPIVDGFVIAPSDVDELPEVTRAIYVGVTGDLRVTLFSSRELTYRNLTGGMMHPIRARKVWATGTTADDLLGQM